MTGLRPGYAKQVSGRYGSVFHERRKSAHPVVAAHFGEDRFSIPFDLRHRSAHFNDTLFECDGRRLSNRIAPASFPRVVGIFDLEPPGVRAIRIAQALGHDPLEVVRAH